MSYKCGLTWVLVGSKHKNAFQISLKKHMSLHQAFSFVVFFCLSFFLFLFECIVIYGIYILSNDSATNPLDKLPAILKKNLHGNLCVCNEVLKIDIINAIADGATSVEDVRRQTYATMGSGCCIQQVKRLIECLGAPDNEE